MGKGVPVLSHRFTPQLGAQESEEAKGQDPGDTPLPNHNVLFLRNWDGEIQRETQGPRQKDRERDSQRAQNSVVMSRGLAQVGMLRKQLLASYANVRIKIRTLTHWGNPQKACQLLLPSTGGRVPP